MITPALPKARELARLSLEEHGEAPRVSGEVSENNMRMSEALRATLILVLLGGIALSGPARGQEAAVPGTVWRACGRSSPQRCRAMAAP